MAYKNQTTVNVSWGGLGCFLLFLLFLGLKLGGAITWSWWWVTAPIWIPWCLGLAIALITGIIYICILLIKSVHNKKLSGTRRK